MHTSKLCDYGCGQEAKFKFKNGKWCCERNQSLCSESIKKKIGKKYSKKIKREKPKVCDYGCGQESKYYFETVNRWCCSENVRFCPIVRKNRSNGQEIRNQKYENPMTGKHHREDSKEKMKINRKPGFIPWNKGKFGLQHQSSVQRERSRQYMLNGHSTYMNTFPRPPVKETTKEKHRQYMLNGGAVKALKGVKNPSKPEVIMREMVKQLYPKCEFQYPVFNYSLDVALINQKLAIEFDGYFHFDCKENIEYHEKRRKIIELEGWKFLRYTIFDKFPTLEQIKEDIKRLLENEP